MRGKKKEKRRKKGEASGQEAAEEAAREERHKIDAMDPEVGWAGVERMNGWMDSAMKPLWRKHAYCRCRSLPRLLRFPRGAPLSLVAFSSYT